MLSEKKDAFLIRMRAAGEKSSTQRPSPSPHVTGMRPEGKAPLENRQCICGGMRPCPKHSDMDHSRTAVCASVHGGQTPSLGFQLPSGMKRAPPAPHRPQRPRLPLPFRHMHNYKLMNQLRDYKN